MYESAHDSDIVPDTFNNFKRFCGIFSCALFKSSMDYRWGKIVKFGGKSFGFPKKATFLITYYYFCFPDIIKGIRNTNYKMFPLLIIV